MTGYGAGSAPWGDDRVVVELRAVNHRHLEIRVRASTAMAPYTTRCEAFVRSATDRGRIEVSLRTANDTRLGLDEARAAETWASLLRIRDAVAPKETLPFSVLFSIPEIFGTPATSPEGVVALQAAVAEAGRALDAMRITEGDALSMDFQGRIGKVETLVQRVEERSPEVARHHRDKLRARIDEALRDTGASLDPSRLSQEIALLADRTDVTEETTRLRGHCAHFRSFMPERTCGRQLDFLLQEMAREANTIASKGADLTISHLAVDLKAEIERMREQAQNVL